MRMPESWTANNPERPPLHDRWNDEIVMQDMETEVIIPDCMAVESLTERNGLWIVKLINKALITDSKRS